MEKQIENNADFKSGGENMNKLTLKVYKIDYDFIIKNYLDRKMWKKTWTLFAYRGFTYTLELDLISVRSNTIYFTIRGNYIGDEENIGYSTYVSHNIENSKISILQNQIDGAIICISKDIERTMIKKSNEYREIENAREDEEEKLREIAENFLDTNDVTNINIRNVYIDYYVDANMRTNDMLNSYVYSTVYKVFPGLFLTLASITDRDYLRDEVKAAVGSSRTDDIMEELEEFLKEFNTDEYTEEMEGNLDEI